MVTGKMNYANGDVYKGHLRDYKKDGLGKITNADGATNKGRWRDDKS